MKGTYVGLAPQPTTASREREPGEDDEPEPEPAPSDNDLDAQLRSFLALLFADGGMRELRCLNVVRSRFPHNAAHPEVGYFRPEDLEALVAVVKHYRDGEGQLPDLSALTTVSGVYYTLNPIKAAAFNRAPAKMVVAKRGETSSDADVAKRTRMLIDIDAPREVNGVPATDAEKAIAFATAKLVLLFMAERGSPAPIKIDSGNGAQLVYAVDLPAEDGGVVEGVLKALAGRFNNGAKVDVSVHNPARIARLPTTWNRKAHSTSSRPHRLARVVALPEVF